VDFKILEPFATRTEVTLDFLELKARFIPWRRKK